MKKQNKAQPYIYTLVTFIFVLVAQWLPQKSLAGPVTSSFKYYEQMGEVLDDEIRIANQRAQRRLAERNEQQKLLEESAQLGNSFYMLRFHIETLSDESIKCFIKTAIRVLIRRPDEMSSILQNFFIPESSISLKVIYASIIYTADHSNIEAYNILKERCTKKEIEDLRTYRILVLEEENFRRDSGDNRFALVGGSSSYEAIYDRITQNIVKRFR